MAGCNERPLEPDQRARILHENIRPGLDSIAPELAILDANNQFVRMVHCSVSRPVDWSSVLCSVFQKSEAFTSSLVQAVMRSQEKLRKGYLFYVKPPFNEGLPDLLGLILTEDDEEPIGLFENVFDCDRSKENFRKFGLQVKPCRSWDEKDVQYRIFDSKARK